MFSGERNNKTRRERDRETIHTIQYKQGEKSVFRD